MDIYKLNKEELSKLRNEFNQTGFGNVVWIYTIFGSLVGIFFISFILGFNIVSYILDGEVLISFITILVIMGLYLSLFSIIQLQYTNMFKEYIKNKKDK